MSAITPTRRTDEPPARDGAPLAGWPTVITAEEAVALRAALKQLQIALDAVARDRDDARAENVRLRAKIERLDNEDTKTRHALKGWVWVCPDGGADPTHERVAAVVAEVERLREALVRGSEVLASHQGSLEREWHSGGAWLYPGDTINVVRAPMPEIEVVP